MEYNIFGSLYLFLRKFQYAKKLSSGLGLPFGGDIAPSQLLGWQVDKLLLDYKHRHRHTCRRSLCMQLHATTFWTASTIL